MLSPTPLLVDTVKLLSNPASNINAKIKHFLQEPDGSAWLAQLV